MDLASGGNLNFQRGRVISPKAVFYKDVVY